MSQFNLFDYDDPVFPVLAGGDAVMESAEPVMEAASDTSAKSLAMSAVLAWIEAGDFTYQAMEEYIAGITDLDGDEEFSEDETALFNDVLAACADAFLSFGADADNVSEFLNDESDAAGKKLGDFVSSAVDEESATDEDIIAGFSGDGSVMESGVLEASFKKMRVVRGGEVKIVKKRLGKVVLSAAQKAGLKKARRKAFSATAKLHRFKSIKVRKQHGM